LGKKRPTKKNGEKKDGPGGGVKLKGGPSVGEKVAPGKGDDQRQSKKPVGNSQITKGVMGWKGGKHQEKTEKKKLAGEEKKKVMKKKGNPVMWGGSPKNKPDR